MHSVSYIGALLSTVYVTYTVDKCALVYETERILRISIMIARERLRFTSRKYLSRSHKNSRLERAREGGTLSLAERAELTREVLQLSDANLILLEICCKTQKYKRYVFFYTCPNSYLGDKTPLGKNRFFLESRISSKQ